VSSGRRRVGPLKKSGSLQLLHRAEGGKSRKSGGRRPQAAGFRLQEE
jgi:hypothetical protein